MKRPTRGASLATGVLLAIAGGPAAAAQGTEAAASGPSPAICGAALDSRSRLRVEGPGQVLVFAPVPSPWRSARHFSLEIEVCPKPGHELPLALKVDADMPAHRHGMNYAPTVRVLSPGRYRADGLMFHMPGRWRVRFDVTAGGRIEQLAREVDVP